MRKVAMPGDEEFEGFGPDIAQDASKTGNGQGHTGVRPFPSSQATFAVSFVAFCTPLPVKKALFL